MAKKFQYNITDTVNDMVACDQIRKEIADGTIVPKLIPDPHGVVCTKLYAFFEFDADLSPAEELELDGIVGSHTGEGLPSADSQESLAVSELPTDGDPGDSFFVTDGNGGPAPAWFDGTDWRWYATGGIVSP